MNVGVRFHDGSEVAYYRSTKIVPTEEGIHIVIGAPDVNGAFEHIALVETSDIKEVFEVELEEAAA